MIPTGHERTVVTQAIAQHLYAQAMETAQRRYIGLEVRPWASLSRFEQHGVLEEALPYARVALEALPDRRAFLLGELDGLRIATLGQHVGRAWSTFTDWLDQELRK